MRPADGFAHIYRHPPDENRGVGEWTIAAGRPTVLGRSFSPPENNSIAGTYLSAMPAIVAVCLVRAGAHMADSKALVAVVAFAGFIKPEKREVSHQFKDIVAGTGKTAPSVGYKQS